MENNNLNQRPAGTAEAEAPAIIRTEGLTKTFGGFTAISDLEMHVPKGAVYGLVGPNGAGKSTLMRLLTGIFRQDAGRISIMDQDPYDNNAVKEKILYIPDELFYHAQDNTEDLRKFYQGLYPSFDQELFEKMREYFPAVDTKKSVHRLSKGMQKQVLFWISICCRPEILILDEPVDGLDPVMRRQIWSILLADVAERGITVLISSHNLRELEDVCDHVGIMHKGKLLLERSLADLQGNISKVQAAYSGEIPDLDQHLNILHKKQNGRVLELIVKGTPEEAGARIEATHPLFADLLPLTLEEIFIYELGGVDYEIKDIFM